MGPVPAEKWQAEHNRVGAGKTGLGYNLTCMHICAAARSDETGSAFPWW